MFVGPSKVHCGRRPPLNMDLAVAGCGSTFRLSRGVLFSRDLSDVCGFDSMLYLMCHFFAGLEIFSHGWLAMYADVMLCAIKIMPVVAFSEPEEPADRFPCPIQVSKSLGMLRDMREVSRYQRLMVSKPSLLLFQLG